MILQRMKGLLLAFSLLACTTPSRQGSHPPNVEPPHFPPLPDGIQQLVELADCTYRKECLAPPTGDDVDPIQEVVDGEVACGKEVGRALDAWQKEQGLEISAGKTEAKYVTRYFLPPTVPQSFIEMVYSISTSRGSTGAELFVGVVGPTAKIRKKVQAKHDVPARGIEIMRAAVTECSRATK